MIVDCHSHVWPSLNSLGKAFDFTCIAGKGLDQALPEDHLAASEPADFVLVLGFVSNLLNAEIANDYLARYVSEHPGRMKAFAGVDPTEGGCLEQIQKIHEEPVFAGLTMGPACQGFHPCDSRAMRVYELAEELGLPVYFLQGNQLPSAATLEHQQPTHFDEVARSFPSLKIVISHMGYPWMDQMAAMLAKHDNMFTDIAGLTQRPWQAYRALIIAYEYGVIEKLLFASDYPNHTVKEAVEAVYNLNKLTLDSVLPAIPREQLRGIVERDSLSLLGLDASTLTSSVTQKV